MNNQIMTQNRKRCRNIHEEDTSEFMPLSKRINNLHINNGFQVLSNCNSSESMFLKATEWGPCYSEETADNVQSQSQSQPQSQSQSQPQSQPPLYNPDLTQSQNPYYYNNKLLFDLYVERTQRSGQSFH